MRKGIFRNIWLAYDTNYKVDLTAKLKALYDGTTITDLLPSFTTPTDSVVTTAELDQLDSSANGALMTLGTGISAITTAVTYYSVLKVGGVITTQILIDLTGLHGGGANDDIIGKDAATVNCNIGQITTAINGTVWGGRIECCETPAGGNPDINLSTSTSGAGAQDAGVAALAGYAQLADCGDHTAGSVDYLTAPPAANSYLYLSNGVFTDAAYSAGRLLITLYGI